MHRTALQYFLGTTCAALVACGGTPGAAPHDMSAAHHDTEAAEQLAAASGHAAEEAKAGPPETSRCASRPKRGGDVAGEACWTSLQNPSDAHRRMAEDHRRQAADHRAASAALRDAEARACVGIAEEDRDASPFDHAEDIASVKPLREPDTASGKPLGAIVTFRAVPGMSTGWLQKVVDCHLARNASLGHVVPEMPNCPLVPNHVTATVGEAADGFTVTIRSEDPDSAREVMSRVARLQSGGAR
jgi:hypothetical protein